MFACCFQQEKSDDDKKRPIQIVMAIYVIGTTYMYVESWDVNMWLWVVVSSCNIPGNWRCTLDWLVRDDWLLSTFQMV